MTFSLLAVAVLMQTVTLTPTDDIWVYPHASDPQRDEFLRVWGAEGKSVAGASDAVESFGYSYLQFDVSSVKPDATLKSAKLYLWHVADPAWTKEDLKATPIEVRAVASGFSEKTWAYESGIQSYPPKAGAEGLFGVTVLEGAMAQGKPVCLVVDLLGPKSSFATYLRKASAGGGKLALALTSAIDPSENRGMVFKLHSKEGPEATRPQLLLAFE